MQVNPYSRVHQEKLTLFREELQCVLKVLESQVDIFKGLSLFLEQPSDTKSAPNQRWREAYIIQDSIESVNGKIQRFNEMHSGADDLARFVRSWVGIRLHTSCADPFIIIEHPTY